jgi:pilus assembly protein CpaF
MTNEEVEDLLDEMVRINSQDSSLSLIEKLDISKVLYHELRGLSELQPLLDDPEITEIMVNGPDSVFVEINGRLSCTNIHFESKEKLEDIIQKVVSYMNRMVNEGSPICDVRLEDGSRVNIVLPPVAIDGPIMTIRKFSKDMMSMDYLRWLYTAFTRATDKLYLVNCKKK